MQAGSPGKSAIAHTGRADRLAIAGVMMSGHQRTHIPQAVHPLRLSYSLSDSFPIGMPGKKKKFKVFLKRRTRERPLVVSTCFKGLHNGPLLVSHLVTLAFCLFCLNTLDEQSVSFHMYKFMA